MSRLAPPAALFLLALAVPLLARAQSPPDKPAAAAPGDACASLTEALEKSGDAMAPVSLAQAREYQRRDDQPACRLALQRIPFGNPPAAVTPAPAPPPATTDQTTAATPQAAPPQPPRTLTVSQMRPMAVWNDKERLGDVRRVVVGPDQQRYVIVATGGFLGIGERLVAVRGDSLRNNGDRLIAEMTEAEIRALPEATDTAYRELPENETITLRP